MYYKHNIVIEYDKKDTEETGFIGVSIINGDDTLIDENDILKYLPRKSICGEHASGVIYLDSELYCLSISSYSDGFVVQGLYYGKLVSMRIPLKYTIIRDTVSAL